MPYKQKGTSQLITCTGAPYLLESSGWSQSNAYKESDDATSPVDGLADGVGLTSVSAGAAGADDVEEEEAAGPRAESSCFTSCLCSGYHSPLVPST